MFAGLALRAFRRDGNGERVKEPAGASYHYIDEAEDRIRQPSREP